MPPVACSPVSRMQGEMDRVIQGFQGRAVGVTCGTIQGRAEKNDWEEEEEGAHSG